jgi:hypothetical protein
MVSCGKQIAEINTIQAAIRGRLAGELEAKVFPIEHPRLKIRDITGAP